MQGFFFVSTRSYLLLLSTGRVVSVLISRSQGVTHPESADN